MSKQLLNTSVNTELRMVNKTFNTSPDISLTCHGHTVYSLTPAAVSEILSFDTSRPTLRPFGVIFDQFR